MAPSTQHKTSSHTSYDSRRESVSGADSNIINPFSSFTSKDFSMSTWAKLIIQKGINRLLSEVEPTGSDDKRAQNTYHDYSPSAPKSSHNYETFLHRLGFKQEEAALGTHHDLVKALRAFLEGTQYFCLGKLDNPAAFRTLVLEFLEEEGPRYWGASNRQHLEEEGPSRGYLYPRDVQRGESSFLDAVESLFDYKARCSRSHYDELRKHIDFAAMTGHKVDAQPLADLKSRVGLSRNSEASSAHLVNPKDAIPKKRRTAAAGYCEDENNHDWNIFDHLETATVLRPNPPRTKWTRESLNRTDVRDDDVQPAQRAGRSKKEGRRRRSNVIHHTSHKLTTPNLHPCTPKNVSRGSSTDSDVPLIQSRRKKKHHPSPPTTRGQSLTTVQNSTRAPGLNSRPSIVSLISESDEERPQKIKNEPLSADARAGTLLKVSMHNQPEKLEISVPLGTCRTSNELFDKLTTEWRLRPEMATKINFISARYRWSGEGHGMRRGESLDWEIFCATIREAWDKKEGDAKEKCIVEMKLIADD